MKPPRGALDHAAVPMFLGTVPAFPTFETDIGLAEEDGSRRGFEVPNQKASSQVALVLPGIDWMPRKSKKDHHIPSVRTVRKTSHCRTSGSYKRMWWSLTLGKPSISCCRSAESRIFPIDVDHSQANITDVRSKVPDIDDAIVRKNKLKKNAAVEDCSDRETSKQSALWRVDCDVDHARCLFGCASNLVSTCLRGNLGAPADCYAH